MEKSIVSLDKHKEAEEAIAVLSEYYGRDEWKQDYADDEAGLLPKNLKRGVLGIWNFLSDWQETKTRTIIRK